MLLEIASLVAEDRVAELGRGTPNLAVHSQLQALERDLPARARDRDCARACVAGLWLHHDFLEESHSVSQELDSAEGSFWHAIMHRREPDAWNSKYWWRRVGSHPVIEQLRSQAPALGYEFTNPEDFVDFCEKVRGAETPDEELAKRVQKLEWKLLFDYCHHKAFSG